MSHHSLFVFILISLYTRKASKRDAYDPNELIRVSVIESIDVLRKFRLLLTSILASGVLLYHNIN